MLDNASKLVAAPKPKTKTTRRPPAEGIGTVGGGWSNDNQNDDENGTPGTEEFIPRPVLRRPPDEIVAADIPTIQTEDVDDDDDQGNAGPQVAVAPEFSIHQIASFKEMENEFSRERASQFIDPKIDIGVLYQNLHLQEDFTEEEQKLWDWDKLFVDIRNAITNPSND